MSALTLAINPNYNINDLKQLTVGTSQVAFPSLTTGIGFTGRPERIFVQALSTNSGTIMIGKTGVASDGSAGGWQLVAGANMNLPITDLSVLYAIGSGAGQKLQITYQSGAI